MVGLDGLELHLYRGVLCPCGRREAADGWGGGTATAADAGAGCVTVVLGRFDSPSAKAPLPVAPKLQNDEGV